MFVITKAITLCLRINYLIRYVIKAVYTNEQAGVLHVKRASPYRKETRVTLHEDVICLTR